MFFFFFCLGFCSLIKQIVLLRELVGWFGGDELFYALGLAFWLLFAGLGNFLFRQVRVGQKKIFWRLWLIFVFILPWELIFFRQILTRLIPLGFAAPVFYRFLFSAILVFPSSLLSGILFSLAINYRISFKSKDKNGLGHLANLSYLSETFGLVAAGLFFTFFLSRTGFPLWSKLDKETLVNHYPDLSEIIYSKQGQLMVSESFGQRVIFSAGKPIFVSGKSLSDQRQTGVLSAVLKNKNRILGFGELNLFNQIVEEFLPQKAVFVFPVAELFDLEKSWLEKSVEPVVADPKFYLANKADKWDLVLVSVGNPDSLLINRYYTVEFLKLVKERLDDNGLLALVFDLPIDYQSQEAIGFGGAVYQTVKSVFGYFDLLPVEERVLVLASRSPVDLGAKEGNPYLASVLADQRRVRLKENFGHYDGSVNSDTFPVAYFNHHLFWQTTFSFILPEISLSLVWLSPIVLLFVLIFGLSRKRLSYRLGFIAALSAFILMALEVLIIFLFQTKIGNLYEQIGMIIASVLLGIILGIKLGGLVVEKEAGLRWCLLLYLPVFTILMANGFWQKSVFFWVLVSVLAGVVEGFVYSLANSLWFSKIEVSNLIYSCELFGSFFGALLTATYLLPGLGLVNLLGFFSLLILAAVLLAQPD